MLNLRFGYWVIALGFLTTGAFAQQKVYWVGIRTVYRANLDGSNIETLVVMPSGNGFYDIELDTFRGKMYWSNFAGDKIHRANLDGSEVEDVVSAGLDTPVGLAIDSDAKKLYWANALNSLIERSDLDGSNRETVLETIAPFEVEIDVAAQHLYWSNYADRVMRVDINGGNIVELYDLSKTSPIDLEVSGLALDLQHGKVYFALIDTWNVFDPGSLLRAELDGSGYEEVIPLMPAYDIATDAVRSKVYWSAGGILRSNLDGSGVDVLVNNSAVFGDDVRGIALDLRPSVPAASTWSLVIMSLLLLTAGGVLLIRRSKRVAL